MVIVTSIAMLAPSNMAAAASQQAYSAEDVRSILTNMVSRLYCYEHDRRDMSSVHQCTRRVGCKRTVYKECQPKTAEDHSEDDHQQRAGIQCVDLHRQQHCRRKLPVLSSGWSRLEAAKKSSHWQLGGGEGGGVQKIGNTFDGDGAHPGILIVGMLCRQPVVCEDTAWAELDAGTARQRPIRTQHEVHGAGPDAGRQFMVPQLATGEEDSDVQAACLSCFRRKLQAKYPGGQMGLGRVSCAITLRCTAMQACPHGRR